MSVIKIRVDDQQIALTNMPVIASGGVEENQIEFDFSSDWAGFACVACFYRENKSYTSLVSATGVASVPYEVTATDGKMWLGVMGVKDGVTKTSELVFYKILQGAITQEFDPGEPTPDIYNQILDYVSGVVDLEQRLIVVENKSSKNAEDIVTQTARIDNMIGSQTNESVTTLWTGTLETKNQSVTLSESIANFDFIDVYTANVDTLFIRKPVTNSIDFDIHVQNMSDDASSQFMRWWESGVSISGTTATITKCVRCYWDDFSTVPVVSQATDGLTITRIDGVKIGHVEDDEIVDSHVGVDGVIYPILGDAIRGQVSPINLSNQAIETLGTYHRTYNLYNRYTVKLNRWLNNDGSITYDDSYAVSDYIDVSEFSTGTTLYFSIDGNYGSSYQARRIALYDVNKNLVAFKDNPNTTAIATTADSKYAVFCFSIVQATAHNIMVNGIANNKPYVDYYGFDTDAEYISLFGQVASGIIPLHEIVDTYVTQDGRILNYYGWSRSDYIDISEYAELEVIADEQTSYNVFFDANKQFISKFTIKTTKTKVQIPSNAVYMMVSVSTAKFDSIRIQPFTTEFVALENETEAIHTDLNYSDEAIENIGEEYRTYNLINKITVSRETFLNSDGSVISDSGYAVSDYIDISSYDVGHRFYFSRNGHFGSGYQARGFAFYDSSKNFVSYKDNPNTTAFDKTSDMAYVRVCFHLSAIDTVMLNPLLNTMPYVPYYQAKWTDKDIARDYILPKASDVITNHPNRSFVFGYFSDNHGQYDPDGRYANRTPHYLNIADRLLNLDFILNTGDLIFASDTAPIDKALMSIMKQNAEFEHENKQIVVLGNHDQNGHTLHNRQELSWTVTHQMFFDACYQSMNRDPNVVWGSKEDLYFYKDYPLKKLRVIVLNVQDCGEEIVTENGIEYLKYDSLTVCGVRQAQLNWLANTALKFVNVDDPSDWQTIICTHIGVRDGITDNYPSVQNYSAIDTIIKGYVNGTSVHATYTDSVNADGLFTVDVSANYTSQGAMPLIGVFSGHNHCDTLYTTNYPQITIDAGYPDSSDRVIGTTNEFCFDVVSVDMENREVYLTRFGFGADRSYTY